MGASDATRTGSVRTVRCGRKRDLARNLGQAFIGGRETIGELRLRETVLERIVAACALPALDFAPSLFAASIAGVGRFAALNEHEG